MGLSRKDKRSKTMLAQPFTLEEQESQTLLIEDPTLYHGFVQLPRLVLYASNLSRDAKLLYAVLLGYAWQEKRCFPGYGRLCDDLDASENMVRKYMRELEATHLLSQRRRGQGKTNIYILHDLRTAKIEVQEHHKIAVAEPQESHDNEETVEKEIANKESGLRDSMRSSMSKANGRNEHLFTHSAVFSSAKDSVLRSLAGKQTPAITSIEPDSSPPQSREKNGKSPRQRKKETAQVHQLAEKRVKPPAWLSGYITDFSREFHDEDAIPSNITRAAHLFERAGLDAETFIKQLYEARRVTQARANIRKRSHAGENLAWPTGYVNRMPYFFSVLEDVLGLKEAP
jgi:hypothetical protein